MSIDVGRPDHCFARRAVACALTSLVLVGFVACKSEEEEPATATDAGSAPDGATPDASPPRVDPDAGEDAGLEPGSNADPRDLDAVEGDPALDIAGSQLYFDNGAPWVRVKFWGAWPPAATTYSWSCSILLGTENAPAVSYSTQANSGVPSTLVDGILESKITFAAEPQGFRVMFGDPKIVFDRYGLECSYQKTATSQWVSDSSGTFVVTTKQSRTFGP